MGGGHGAPLRHSSILIAHPEQKQWKGKMKRKMKENTDIRGLMLPREGFSTASQFPMCALLWELQSVFLNGSLEAFVTWASVSSKPALLH